MRDDGDVAEDGEAAQETIDDVARLRKLNSAEALPKESDMNSTRAGGTQDLLNVLRGAADESVGLWAESLRTRLELPEALSPEAAKFPKGQRGPRLEHRADVFREVVRSCGSRDGSEDPARVAKKNIASAGFRRPHRELSERV